MCDYPETQKTIREICLRLLTRREHSQLELLDKLTIKGFERLETQPVIDDLILQGWQSDLRFSESYCRHRINRGYGPIKITNELQQRGIFQIDLDSILHDIADNWGEILEQVYEKKYRNCPLLTKTEWIKRCRFLQQRGFSAEMIRVLLNQKTNDA